jgi:hypothetical protein
MLSPKKQVVLQVVESDSNDISNHWKARKTKYASNNSYAINKAGSPATPGKQYHKLYIQYIGTPATAGMVPTGGKQTLAGTHATARTPEQE